MAYQHQPSARDAGLLRVAALTTALSVAGTAATAGIWVAIAAAAPNPKAASADYSGGKSTSGKANTGAVSPGTDKPESSSGDEQTTSGGS